MAKRFYQLALPSRELWWGDIGERLTITGLVMEGEATPVIILTPDSSAEIQGAIRPTIEEWSEIIEMSDDPQIFELDETGGIKAAHRKVKMAISGQVQQKIWARDEFKCVFCNRKMGQVQLTIDHFMPLELGGANDESNYISACRKCNKRKGNKHPVAWCKEQGYDYDYYMEYLEEAMTCNAINYSG